MTDGRSDGRGEPCARPHFGKDFNSRQTARAFKFGRQTTPAAPKFLAFLHSVVPLYIRVLVSHRLLPKPAFDSSVPLHMCSTEAFKSITISVGFLRL